MKKLWIGFGILVVLFVVIYCWFKQSDYGKEKMDIQATTRNIKKEIESSKQYVTKTAEWSNVGKEETDIGYFNPPKKEEHHKSQKEDVLKYFVTGLIEQDADIFLSSFYPQSISEDLFANDNPNKLELVKNIMKRISREEKIKDILYSIEMGSLNQESNIISVTILYEDQQKAGFKLEIISLKEDSHHSEDKNVYVISTSVWDIIEQIENSVD